MAPRPQIIGQSAHAPEGSEAVASTDQAAMDPASIDRAQAGTSGASAVPSPVVRLDPTRYGDWERNGRCIDF